MKVEMIEETNCSRQLVSASSNYKPASAATQLSAYVPAGHQAGPWYLPSRPLASFTFSSGSYSKPSIVSPETRYEINLKQNQYMWKRTAEQKFQQFKAILDSSPLLEPALPSPLYDMIKACPSEWEALGMPALRECLESELVELIKDQGRFLQALREMKAALKNRQVVVEGSDRAAELWEQTNTREVEIRKREMVSVLLKWIQYDAEQGLRDTFADKAVYVQNFLRKKTAEYRSLRPMKISGINKRIAFARTSEEASSNAPADYLYRPGGSTLSDHNHDVNCDGHGDFKKQKTGNPVELNALLALPPR